MIKIAGALTVMLACALVARELVTQNRKRRSECEGFLALLRAIRRQIGSFSAPLGQIFSEFSDPALDAAGFTEELAHGDLRSALDGCAERLSVGGEVLSLMYDFSDGLGRSYREEELESIDRYIGELESVLDSLKHESVGKTKLACSMAVTFGLMLIIILV